MEGALKRRRAVHLRGVKTLLPFDPVTSLAVDPSAKKSLGALFGGLATPLPKVQLVCGSNGKSTVSQKLKSKIRYQIDINTGREFVPEDTPKNLIPTIYFCGLDIAMKTGGPLTPLGPLAKSSCLLVGRARWCASSFGMAQLQHASLGNQTKGQLGGRQTCSRAIFHFQ